MKKLLTPTFLIFSIFIYLTSGQPINAGTQLECDPFFGFGNRETITVRTFKDENTNEFGFNLKIEKLLKSEKYVAEIVNPDGTKTAPFQLKDHGEDISTYENIVKVSVEGEYKIRLVQKELLADPVCETSKFLVSESLVDDVIPVTPPPGSPGGTPGGTPGSPITIGGDGGIITASGTPESDVGEIVAWIYKVIFPVAVLIAIFKYLILLIQLSASAGDPQKLSEVKEGFYSTTMGLIVIGGAVTLINILGSVIGA